MSVALMSEACPRRWADSLANVKPPVVETKHNTETARGGCKHGVQLCIELVSVLVYIIVLGDRVLHFCSAEFVQCERVYWPPVEPCMAS